MIWSLKSGMLLKRNFVRSSLFLVFVFGILSCIFIFNRRGNFVVNIIHTNDIHGSFESIWGENGLETIGLDLIKSVKKSLPNSILVDAGDALQGSALCTLDQKSVIDLMNEANFDIRVPGNHDFDFAVNQVIHNTKMSNCPVLAANVVDKNNLPILSGINGNNGQNFIIEINGKKFGFFGLVTTETVSITPPDNIVGVKFKDEIEVAKDQVKELKSRDADVIIAITHVGVSSSVNCTSEQLAKEIDGIDIIIDGHSHTKMTKKINNTIIQQTGAQSHNLGIIEIHFKRNGKFNIDAYVMEASEVGKKFFPDSNLSDMYKRCMDEFRPMLEREIGHLDDTLFGGSYRNQSVSRCFETNLGDIICDSMIDYAENSDIGKNVKGYENMHKVAFMIGGGIRKTLKKGVVRYKDIIECMFHGNKISLQIITPKILYEILEYGVGKLKYPDDESGCFKGAFGSFPQVSGFQFYFDISKEPYDYELNKGGQRVTSILTLYKNGGRGGRFLEKDDDKTKLVLLSNDTMLYSIPPIANIKKEGVGQNLTDILASYINKISSKNGSVKYDINKRRINLENNGMFRCFESSITVKDSSGLLTNTELDVSFDNNEFKKVKTDSHGKIHQFFDTGMHLIKIKHLDLEGEILVSNLCDLKDGEITLNLNNI